MSFILKESVQISSNDHIQINIKLFAFDIRIKKRYLTPPLFPARLKWLYFYVLVKTWAILGKAIKSDWPGSIAFDSSEQFVYVICGVSSAPFDAKHVYVFLFGVGYLGDWPRNYLYRFEALILLVHFSLCIVDNLIPSVFYRLLFLT